MPTEPEILLVPRPQRLTFTGGTVPVQPTTEVPDDSLPVQGYRLTIGGDGVVLRHRDDLGRRYGHQAMTQIIGSSLPGPLPALQIDDWPDFPVRGFMLDISRDRVPTRETLSGLVELMALARINQFQLYTEHTFAYRDHEVVWRDASPLTADDIAWLDELCGQHGIELVPNQNCFGHMHRWLEHEAYRHRAEAPDGYELIPGDHREASVLQPTPDNAAFALALFDELLPNFTSRQVNIDCDETFELGMGASRAEVERRGREAVYLEHLLRIVGPLRERGYTVQFWADVLRRDPALVRQLPDGVVPIAWTYEAPARSDGDGPRSLPPEIREALDRAGIDADAHRGFAENTAPLAEAGIPFWVAPGTSSWLSLVGRIDNALANLLDAAEVGLERGAEGYLITDWGDGGHMQPPSVSFGPLLYGGAVSWSLAANRDLDLPAVLDTYAFRDGAGVLGGVLDRLGRTWRKTGLRTSNCSPLYLAVAPDIRSLTSGSPDAAKLVPLVDELDGLLADIARSQAGAVVRHELTTATRLARHGAYRLLRVAGGPAPDTATLRADITELIDAHTEAWLARARPGGLPDSLAHLLVTLADYT